VLAEPAPTRSQWILAAISLAFLRVLTAYWRGFQIDDAYISVRYPCNLAAGAGLALSEDQEEGPRFADLKYRWCARMGG